MEISGDECVSFTRLDREAVTRCSGWSSLVIISLDHNCFISFTAVISFGCDGLDGKKLSIIVGQSKSFTYLLLWSFGHDTFCAFYYLLGTIVDNVMPRQL